MQLYNCECGYKFESNNKVNYRDYNIPDKSNVNEAVFAERFTGVEVTEDCPQCGHKLTTDALY